MSSEAVRLVCKAFGVSEGYLYAARRVKREGPPELAALVMDGRAKLHEAIRALDTMTPEEVQEACRRVMTGEVRRLRDLLPPTAPATNRRVAALQRAWTAATPEERGAFVEWLRSLSADDDNPPG